MMDCGVVEFGHLEGTVPGGTGRTHAMGRIRPKLVGYDQCHPTDSFVAANPQSVMTQCKLCYALMLIERYWA